MSMTKWKTVEAEKDLKAVETQARLREKLPRKQKQHSAKRFAQSENKYGQRRYRITQKPAVKLQQVSLIVEML